MGQKLPSRNTATIVINACNHRQCWNQNGATIIKATFFFCHCYIVWESDDAGEARGQSWHESLKSRWTPGGSCGYTSGTKRKHFAALSSPRPYWRWLQLQPSCGSPQWIRVMACHLFELSSITHHLVLGCGLFDTINISLWRNMTPDILINVSSGNGLSPVRHQATLFGQTLEDKLHWDLNQNTNICF